MDVAVVWLKAVGHAPRLDETYVFSPCALKHAHDAPCLLLFFFLFSGSRRRIKHDLYDVTIERKADRLGRDEDVFLSVRKRDEARASAAYDYYSRV